MGHRDLPDDLARADELITKLFKEFLRPPANETVSLSRLTLVVEVALEHRLDAKKNFSQRFTATRDYPATQDLSAVESGLMDEMCRELAEKIFTRALVQW
jgi:hypothetical protein